MAEEDYDADLYDQNPAESDTDQPEREPAGEPFLAPKASFKGDLSPGTIHRVRIEASHGEELELVCLGTEVQEEQDESEQPDSEIQSLYE